MDNPNLKLYMRPVAKFSSSFQPLGQIRKTEQSETTGTEAQSAETTPSQYQITPFDEQANNEFPQSLQQLRHDNQETFVLSQTYQNLSVQHRNLQFHNPILTCNDIFVKCNAPEFMHCHKLCSLMVFCGGIGLDFCCCYGRHRIDCPSVCCAGNMMFLTSCCLYGEFVACIVGIRMCKLSSEQYREIQ